MNQSIGIDSFNELTQLLIKIPTKENTQKNPTNKTTKSKKTHTQIKRENIKKKIVKGINKFIFFSGLLLNIMLF